MRAATSSLLERYMRELVLNERIRGRSFKLSEFKELRDPWEMDEYAVKHGLKQLGEGTARAAYLLSSTKVLKIALWAEPEKGRAQNEAELDVFTDPRTRPIVARIFDYDPSFNWLISELVKPTSYVEFKKLMGIDLSTLKAVIDTFDGSVEAYIDDLASNVSKKRARALAADERALKFINGVVALNRESDVELGDIVRPDHWGRTLDGRFMLLDYGYTTSVRKKFYDVASDSDQGLANFTSTTVPK